MELHEVEMNCDAVELGKFYIWVLPYGEKKVVWPLPDKDGIVEYDTFNPHGDCWFFEHDLVGKLYGPISFPADDSMNKPV